MSRPALELAATTFIAAGATDRPALQALIASDAETWTLLEGAPPRADEAYYLLTECPPAVPLANKEVWLAPTCVLELLRGFPDATTWYLGLLFIAPHARGQGLGTRLLVDLAAHVHAHGGTALRLGVVAENVAARRFYDRLGFAHVARRPRETWAGTTQQVDVLELDVTRPPLEAAWQAVEDLATRLPLFLRAEDRPRFRALLARNPTMLELLVLLAELVADHDDLPAELRAKLAPTLARARAFPEIADTRITPGG